MNTFAIQSCAGWPRSPALNAATTARMALMPYIVPRPVCMFVLFLKLDCVCFGGWSYRDNSKEIRTNDQSLEHKKKVKHKSKSNHDNKNRSFTYHPGGLPAEEMEDSSRGIRDTR